MIPAKKLVPSCRFCKPRQDFKVLFNREAADKDVLVTQGPNNTPRSSKRNAIDAVRAVSLGTMHLTQIGI